MPGQLPTFPSYKMLPLQAGVLRSLGQPAQAEKYARQALSLREAAYGSESREAASAYHSLAEALLDLERSPFVPLALQTDLIDFAALNA